MKIFLIAFSIILITSCELPSIIKAEQYVEPIPVNVTDNILFTDSVWERIRITGQIKQEYLDEKTIEYICHKLKINMFQPPKKPNEEKFIYGKAIEICDKEKILMKNFIKEEIKKFPNLPNDLLNLF